MSKKNLLLVTNYFPYHKGEEYLESELPYLSKYFDDITVIPTMVSHQMELTRSVPDNCKILTTYNDLSLWGKVKIILGFFRVFRRKSFYYEDGKLINRLFSAYFETRSQIVLDRLRKRAKELSFLEEESIAIYAYWLYVTARVAVGIREEIIQRSDVYVFSRAHGYDVFPDANQLNFLPQRLHLLKSLDNVFPVSSFAVNRLQQSYPEFRNKISVRRLGTLPIIDQISDRYEQSVDDFLIVSCSMIRKLKRIDLLIDSLALLEKSGVNFKWVHFGNGPLNDEIRAKAKESLKQENFCFMGHVSNDSVRDWYRKNQASLFINLSTSEGVPVSIMEAQSVGLPVIATNVGGTSEIVINEENGFLLDSEGLTQNVVSDAIIKYIALPDSRKLEISKKAYSYWEKNYNAEQNYIKFANEIIDRTQCP